MQVSYSQQHANDDIPICRSNDDSGQRVNRIRVADVDDFDTSNQECWIQVDDDSLDDCIAELKALCEAFNANGRECCKGSTNDPMCHGTTRARRGYDVHFPLDPPAFTPDCRRRFIRRPLSSNKNSSSRLPEKVEHDHASSRKKPSRLPVVVDKTDLFFNRMESTDRPRFYKGKKRGPIPRKPSLIAPQPMAGMTAGTQTK